MKRSAAIVPVLAAGIALFQYDALRAQSATAVASTKVANGAIAATVVGRAIASADGTVEVAAYYPFISGIGRDVFSGTPSEKTAHFTVRSSRVRPVSLANASILHLRLAPVSGDNVEYYVYYQPSPNNDFSRPESFSEGEPIARLHIATSIATLVPGSGLAFQGTMVLDSSKPFTFRDKTYDFGALGNQFTVLLNGPGIAAADLAGGSTLSVPVGGVVMAASE